VLSQRASGRDGNPARDFAPGGSMKAQGRSSRVETGRTCREGAVVEADRPATRRQGR
jgi:hypothetical protein